MTQKILKNSYAFRTKVGKKVYESLFVEFYHVEGHNGTSMKGVIEVSAKKRCNSKHRLNILDSRILRALDSWSEENGFLCEPFTGEVIKFWHRLGAEFETRFLKKFGDLLKWFSDHSRMF